MDPFAPTKSKSAIKRPVQNFVEALKSIGGHTVQSVGNDVVRGFGSDMMNSIFGATPNNPDANPEMYNPELRAKDERDWQAEMERRARHQEVLQTTPLYDRREEEVKAQIKSLQDELKALAVDLTNLSLTTQNALEASTAHPGQYHVTFLEKLRRFIVNLRKQVANANNWLEISYARRQAKQFYWGGVSKGGTKFMLSQERYMATSAG